MMELKDGKDLFGGPSFFIWRRIGPGIVRKGGSGKRGGTLCGYN
jgi:hypothetical protein